MRKIAICGVLLMLASGLVMTVDPPNAEGQILPPTTGLVCSAEDGGPQPSGYLSDSITDWNFYKGGARLNWDTHAEVCGFKRLNKIELSRWRSSLAPWDWINLQVCDWSAGSYVIAYDHAWWEGHNNGAGCNYVNAKVRFSGHEGYEYWWTTTVQGFWKDLETGGNWRFVGQKRM